MTSLYWGTTYIVYYFQTAVDKQTKFVSSDIKGVDCRNLMGAIFMAQTSQMQGNIFLGYIVD